MNGQRAPLRLALFGDPLEHSLSPRLHHNYAQWLGRSLEYHLLPSTGEGFIKALHEASQKEVIGANVTSPHKALALTHCDQLTPLAAHLGVVNTLTWTAQGIEGHNTDVAGVFATIKALKVDRGAQGLRRVRLIGAGGGARAAAWAALDFGIEALEVVSRRQVASDELIEWLKASHPNASNTHASNTHAKTTQLTAHTITSSAALPPPSLCILATPPLNISTLNTLCGTALKGKEPPAIFDMNYASRASVSRDWAGSHGLAYRAGELMLAEQGRRSFERWTGALPPLSRGYTALDS